MRETVTNFLVIIVQIHFKLFSIYFIILFCCRYLGEGMPFNTDEKSWKIRRSVLEPAFHHK